MLDRFADFKLHHTRFDWTDTSLTPDKITQEIIGKVLYWSDQDYEGLTPLEIERQILFEGGRDQWYQESPYGKMYYQHYLTLMKLMFPDTDITPSLADATEAFCRSLGFRKMLNLIGCQSSSKSASTCRIMFTAMYVDPDYTVGYIATPFDSAADSSAWGDCLELWDELVLAHPHKDGTDVPSLFPDGRKYAHKKLVFKPGVAKAGSIELRNIKHTGKLKGAKTRGKITDRGIMFMNIDEINEIDNVSFLSTVENVASQKAFFSLTTQNFKDEDDMGGAVTSPVALFPCYPGTFDDLDINRDQFWYSAKSSVTLRFDGHQSPNILAKRVVYPYLIDQKDIDRLRESGGGEESMIYLSQARSFPIKGGGLNSVLSKAKISNSRHKDVHYQMLSSKGSASFCDPAFGGRDSAVWGWAQWGLATVLDGAGKPFEQELLVFSEHLQKLSITKGAFYNDHWFERLAACGLDISKFVEGAEVSVEDQVAIQCLEKNRAAGVKSENFGFDFSMRPDIVSSMNKFHGFEAKAMSYNHKPDGYFLENTKQLTEEVCKNLNTEMAMMAADIVLTKQLRGGALVETALTQLSRTYIEMANNKYLTEDKKAYKLRWSQKSPDERDTFLGITKMALDAGFRKDNSQASSIGGDAWAMLHEEGFMQARTYEKI
tara:strand:- start:5299 stop:7275 length:1977 start_codon:yes stop_codon:yes gene_type:complete